MVVNEVTPPAAEPIELDEAKAHLRVAFDDDDALITSLISAARRFCEARGKLVCVNTTFDLVVDGFPGRRETGERSVALGAGVVTFPRAPLVSISSVSYVDPRGLEQLLDLSGFLIVPGSPGRLAPRFGEAWPSTLPRIGAVTVRFVAGYGAAAAAVPSNVKAAIKLVLGHLYENRELVSQDRAFAAMPADLAVDALLAVEAGSGGYA